LFLNRFILTRVSKDMPIYRPLVPNGHSDSPQMISGSGLELSGGKFSLKDLAKGVGKAANVAIPLAQAFGVEGADQAAAVNNAIQGQGFGKGTQRKMLAAAKKGAKVADKLIDEFGDEKLKRKKNTAKTVASIVSGSGSDGHSPAKKMSKQAAPAEALRKMVNRGVARS